MSKFSPFKSLSLGLFSVFGISLIIIFFTKCVSFNKVIKDIEVLGENSPMEIIYENVSRDFAKQAESKYLNFKTSLLKGNKDKMVLSISELNSLIVFHPRLEGIKNKISLFIGKNQKLFARISVPSYWLTNIDKSLKNKYFNGEAEFYLYMKKKLLTSPFLFLALKVLKNSEGKPYTSFSFFSEYNLFGYFARTKEEYQAIEELISLVKSVEIKNRDIILSN